MNASRLEAAVAIGGPHGNGYRFPAAHDRQRYFHTGLATAPDSPKQTRQSAHRLTVHLANYIADLQAGNLRGTVLVDSRNHEVVAYLLHEKTQPRPHRRIALTVHAQVTENGLEQIDPVGEKFDPERHQAISMVEAENAKSNTVVEVMQKGFLLNDRLVRPAMVVVAK